jgi:hypothetical protein
MLAVLPFHLWQAFAIRGTNRRLLLGEVDRDRQNLSLPLYLPPVFISFSTP